MNVPNGTRKLPIGGERMTEMRRIRKHLGMSVKELASVVGVAPMSIYRYEQGRRIPDIIVAAKIAKALNCTIDQLIGEKKVG